MGQPPRRSDTPVPGFYLLRLCRGGPWVGAEIRLEDGQWFAMVDGVTQGPSADPWFLSQLEQIHWYGRTTTQQEVLYRIGLKRHAEIYAPNAAAANPRQPVNIETYRPYRRKV